MKSSYNMGAGVGERMQYLAHKYNDTTIRFILRYPGLLSSEILCIAADAVINKVDVLHSSFIANSQTCHWRVNADYQISDYFSVLERDGDPVKVASGLESVIWWWTAVTVSIC